MPTLSSDQTAVLCSKCGGTGFYCMGTLNGSPFSTTGFTCFPCNGTGWIIKSKRRKKAVCPLCNLKQYLDENGVIEPHAFMTKMTDGSWSAVDCSTRFSKE